MDSKKVPLPGSERHPAGTRVGDVVDDEAVEVSVILKPKARVETPHAGGAVLSREEFAAAYGADPAAIERVEAFAKEHNLRVVEIAPERRTVRLEGSAADMSKAFEVPFERYEQEGQQYRARTGAIHVPAELAPSIEAVLGLDDRPQAKPHFRVRCANARASTPKAVAYSPRQVAELYQFPLDVDGTGTNHRDSRAGRRLSPAGPEDLLLLDRREGTHGSRGIGGQRAEQADHRQ